MSRSDFLSRILNKNKSVLVIGGGISGLISAYHFNKQGYKVEVVTKSPEVPVENGTSESSTFDGLDQRYLTLYEGHPYLEFINYVCAVYPNIGKDFLTDVLEGGWLAMTPAMFNEKTQGWLEKRRKINEALQNGEVEIIEKVKADFEKYTEENRFSMIAWYEILIEMIENEPGLANELLINYGGIIRLFDEPDVYEAACASHERDGVLKKRSTPEELAREMPAYAAGVENGFIKGGALEMFGLAIGVKTFAEALTRKLKKQGADFSYKTDIKHIEQAEDGQIEYVVDAKGRQYDADYYSFNPGPYAGELFDLLKLENKRHDHPSDAAGMEGYWIEIKPKTEGKEEIYDVISGMAGKANKVHGKQSIQSCLDKVSPELRQRMEDKLIEIGISASDFSRICPTVDFNIMPLYTKADTKIGVGSGYTFVGIGATNPETGKVEFAHSDKAQEFTQVMMQLWLEALYGPELLNACEINVKKDPCIRSWTPADESQFFGKNFSVNLGANTGVTTLAHATGISGTQHASGQNIDIRVNKDGIGAEVWNALERKLHNCILKTQEHRLSVDWLAKVLQSEKPLYEGMQPY